MKGFPFDLVPAFTPKLEVGYRERNLGDGHRVGDYAVTIRGTGVPVAKMEGIRVLAGEPGNYQTVEVPALENAHLFAAAPKLFDGCKEAYVMLQAFWATSDSHEVQTRVMAALQKLEDAMRAAVPTRPGEGPAPAQPHVHKPECGKEGNGCLCSVDWESMR